MDNICGVLSNGTPTTMVTVGVYPSGPISTSTGSQYDQNTPFSNNNFTTSTCGTKTENGLTIRYGGDDDFSATGYSNISLGFPWMSNPVTSPIPAGYWQYRENGVIKAEFDVAVAVPINTNNLITTPVPVIELNTSVTGTINSVGVKWYRLNDAGNGYVEITDPSELKHLVASAQCIIESISYPNGTGGMTFNRETGDFDPSVQSTFTPGMFWNAGANGDPSQQVGSVEIFYESGGIGFFFQYHKP